jgi:hypothetical protein
MGEDSGTTWLGLLKDVLIAWRDRNERNAVEQANRLTFWRDGMLEQIEKIADGKATKKTFNDLKKNLEQSEEAVDNAVNQLRRLRGRITDPQIKRQVDEILHNPHFGKNMIRVRIGHILTQHERHQGRNGGEEVRIEAVEVARAIEILNAELKSLYRMVYGSVR